MADLTGIPAQQPEAGVYTITNLQGVPQHYYVDGCGSWFAETPIGPLSGGDFRNVVTSYLKYLAQANS